MWQERQVCKYMIVQVMSIVLFKCSVSELHVSLRYLNDHQTVLSLSLSLSLLPLPLSLPSPSLSSQGDTIIRYFEIVDAPPYIHFLSLYQTKDPQRGMGCMPKRELDYMKCEVMRFYRLVTKGYAEPTSMTVPRKVRYCTCTEVPAQACIHVPYMCKRQSH